MIEIRRRTLLKGALWLAATELSGCSDYGDSAYDLGTDWTRRAPGSPAERGDEGKPIEVSFGKGATQAPYVDGSGLRVNLDRPGAVYLSQIGDRAVDKIGADFSVREGSSSGSLCLAVWAGTPRPEYGPLPLAPCHFVVTPDMWMFGIWTGTGLVNYGSGVFNGGLPRRRICSTEVNLLPSTVYITLPDGSAQSLAMQRRVSDLGRVACWEFYKDEGAGANFSLHRTWASY